MHQVPSGDAAAAPSASLGHVTLRLPPFWAANPAVWFYQVESQFPLAGITSQLTKYRHVLSVLPQEIAAEVIDILSSPPAEAPYDTLKAAILDRTVASERARLQQLLSAEELGDRTPTQLLRHMQSLLGDRASSFDPKLLKELFLKRLPPTVQMILATAASLTLPDLAAHADRIMEVAPSSLCAISSPTPGILPLDRPQPQPTPPCPDALSRLQADVARLSDMMAAILPGHSSRRRSSRRFRRGSRSSSRSRDRAGSPQSQDNHAASPGPCWYHERFGANARRCTIPCSWQGNDTGGH